MAVLTPCSLVSSHHLTVTTILPFYIPRLLIELVMFADGTKGDPFLRYRTKSGAFKGSGHNW